MIDFDAAQVRSHRRNIERYCRLLATELTDLERRYLHKRIAEEHAQLKQLEKRQGKRGGPAAHGDTSILTTCSLH
jgi:predicted Ser/Thr protein kinase